MTLRLVISDRLKTSSPQTLSNEPARVCAEAELGQPFHYWRGATGRRYLHTVFSLIECPQLPKANYMLVRCDENGERTALKCGQTIGEQGSINLADLRCQGARLGANEVHVHLLAETRESRRSVTADLRNAQAAHLAELLAPRAANQSFH